MKYTAMAAMLLMFACGALADDETAGWRVGGSLSFSDFERDDRVISDGGTGFKGFAQYRFNSWFGVEGDFYVSPEFQGDAALVSAGGEVETSYRGVSLNAIGYLPSPVERMDFYLKGGYFKFFDVNLAVDGANVDSGSEDGLALGIGTSIEARDNLGVRIEFDWYDVSGAELWTIDIGAEYRF
ncbi:MAG: porin family protein [Gammaproteobacteria bacterium]